MVDVDKSIDITKLPPSARVALRNDSYVLHLVLPSKVDPLVSLMRVEKVPDSTYDMIGGLDQQIKEIKEVRVDHAGIGFRGLLTWATNHAWHAAYRSSSCRSSTPSSSRASESRNPK